MLKSLHPSNLDEFIDLSEETELLDSMFPNNKNSKEDAVLKNLKHLQLKEINHEENKREIEKECRIEKKASEDIQWFDEANAVYHGELKSWKRLNDKYKGEIKCGVPHGHGLYMLDDDLSYYKGEFEVNLMGLELCMIIQEAIMLEVGIEIIVGSWYRNNSCNFGKQIYGDGDIYEGNWNENQFNGYGILIMKNGACYRGNWGEGKKSGHGIFKYEDGTVYNCTWTSNWRKKGVINYPNGCNLKENS